VLPVLSVLGSSVGCTLIGAAVGASVDRHAAKVVKPMDVRDVRALEAGATIELQLKDGRSLRGRYRGLDWTLTDTRLSQYAAISGPLARELDLPAPGEAVRVTLAGSGSTQTGELLGYGGDFLVLSGTDGAPPTRVLTTSMRSLADAEGRTLSRRELSERLARGEVPLVAGLRLEQDGASEEIPFDEVAAIGRVTTPNRGKVTGLLVGLLIDAIVIPRTLPPFCDSCISGY